jgi:hypothetical protein
MKRNYINAKNVNLKRTGGQKERKYEKKNGGVNYTRKM